MEQVSKPMMMPVLGELARLAAGPRGEPLPLRLVRACTIILGADGGAITLANTRPERMTLCVTDDVAARLEDLQDVLGEGPGAQAYLEDEIVVLHLGDDRVRLWPRFTEAARDMLGELSLHAVPIRPGRNVLGVLSVYGRTRRPLTRDEQTTQLLVNAVGVALIDDAEEMANQDNPLADGPWSARDQIHQATGMVIAQLGVGPEDAVAMLRAHAYAHELTLAEISEQVLTRRLDFSTVDSEGGQPA